LIPDALTNEGERKKDPYSVFPSSIIAGNLAEWGLEIGSIQFLTKYLSQNVDFFVRVADGRGLRQKGKVAALLPPLVGGSAGIQLSI
jgi:hypothetical protein